MAQKIENLNSFLIAMAELLELISKCQDVLFREDFRTNLSGAITEVTLSLRELAPSTEPSGGERNLEAEYYEGMKAAGLVEGPQLKLKLESFQSALAAFQTEAGEERLEEALDAGEKILESLAGAIPIFGSSAEELIEFILMELRKRWRRRR